MGSALLAMVLAAEIHGGGMVGPGFGAPFTSNLNPGFVLELKVFGDCAIADKVTAGVVLPVSFGFNRQNVSFVDVNWFVVDLMPGARGTYAITEWIRGTLELGLGPSIGQVKSTIPGFFEQTDTRTLFGMRMALGIELSPPSLSGVTFAVEPVAIQARFGNNTWSEYRVTVLAGYRR